ncbi:MAG: VCBS repeat-containing protein, partial [Cyclobacteriaceae bacterium]|nr:VCBS repeat-containing protein [Cyclobacteriaceae bacterium]
DNDGDLDLVLNNLDGPAVIKENYSDRDTTSHFLSLELVGKQGNTKAIGAKAEVFSQAGYQFFELFPIRGFKSSVDPRIHIGLGNIEVIDTIRIKWPGGGKTVLHDVEVDRFLKLSETEATVSDKSKVTTSTIFTSISNKELGVDYVHRENTFIEFNREPLIPHMHSQEGPALAIADINGDGLDDFYIGGAKYQKGSIYLQIEGGFALTEQTALVQDELAEDVDASFFDFDKDGDQDLVVVSGGNEFDGDSPNRQPRLYMNDGTGNFTLLPNAFEGVYQTGSSIAVYDFDGDGWQDVFFGSLVVPWNYGLAPQSYLLKNDSGSSFVDVSHFLPNNGVLGMINDAEWIDLNENGKKSLVLAGEWMDITILSLKGAEFEASTIPESSGWWKTINHKDYDGDGDQDLLAGNMGLNSKLKATKKKPLNLYLNDFDRNGKLDAVMTYNTSGKESIFASRNILVTQIPSIGPKFPTNRAYAEASLKDIFGDGLSQATKLTVKELRSGVFINDGNGFHFEPFPNIMQISFIQDFLIADINADGLADIFSAGNLFASSIQEGRYAADRGAIIIGLPDNPKMLSNHDAGLSLGGDIRHIKSLNYKGKKLIMVVRNNDSIKWLMRK